MKKKIFYIIESVLILAGVILYLFPVMEYVPVSNAISMSALGEFGNDSTIDLPIIVSSNTIDSVSFTFVTYCQENKYGNVDIIILNEKDEVLYSENIPVKEIEDNEQFIFNFEKQKNTYGKKFKVRINTHDFKDETRLSILCGETQDDNRSIIINGEKTTMAFCYSIGGDVGNRVYSWYLFMLSAILFCYHSINYKEN